MSEFQLTRWQRTRLQRQLQQTRDARVHRRTLAVLEYSYGRSVAAIARLLRVTRQSVYNWIDAYTQDHDPAALRDEERSGRPRCWTKKLRKRLQTLLGQTPDQLGYLAVNWTVPLLQQEIERRTDQWLSEDTIRRELACQGYAWKRGRYVLDPDPQREKKTLDLPLDSLSAAPQCGARGGRNRPVAVPAFAGLLGVARAAGRGAAVGLECPARDLRGHELAQRQPPVPGPGTSAG